MATQKQWLLVDDLDGSRPATTIEFGLDGRSYAIDLSAENAAQLRAVLGEFIAAARVQQGARAPALRHAPHPRATVTAPVAAGTPPAPPPSLRAELGGIVRGLSVDIRRLLFEILAVLLRTLRGRLAARRDGGGATGSGDGSA